MDYSAVMVSTFADCVGQFAPITKAAEKAQYIKSQDQGARLDGISIAWSWDRVARSWGRHGGLGRRRVFRRLKELQCKKLLDQEAQKKELEKAPRTFPRASEQHRRFVDFLFRTPWTCDPGLDPPH